MVSEALKTRYHHGLPPDLHHVRDHRGREVDVLHADGDRRLAVEVKSGLTVSQSQLTPLHGFRERSGKDWELALVYGGTEGRERSGVRLVPWQLAGSLFGPA